MIFRVIFFFLFTKRRRLPFAHMDDLYLQYNLPHIINSLAIGLGKLSKTNDLTEDMSPDCFVGDNIPDIPLLEYVTRCGAYFNCSSSCFVVTCMYIDRLRSYNDHLVIHSHNVHRIFLTALVLACKYVDDRVYTNRYYARCGGLTLQILNESEILFLEMFHFDLGVEIEMFEMYTRNMTKKRKIYRG